MRPGPAVMIIDQSSGFIIQLRAGWQGTFSSGKFYHVLSNSLWSIDQKLFRTNNPEKLVNMNQQDLLEMYRTLLPIARVDFDIEVINDITDRQGLVRSGLINKISV